MGIRISVTWGPGYPLENQMKSLLEGTGKDSAIKFVILWQTVEIVLNQIPGLQHYEVIWHVSISDTSGTEYFSSNIFTIEP